MINRYPRQSLMTFFERRWTLNEVRSVQNHNPHYFQINYYLLHRNKTSIWLNSTESTNVTKTFLCFNFRFAYIFVSGLSSQRALKLKSIFFAETNFFQIISFSLSLSLSLSHTHRHTHTPTHSFFLSLPLEAWSIFIAAVGMTKLSC